MLGVIAHILERRASEGWLVGGSVRDRILGRYSPDLDVVVADDASEVAKRLASDLRSPWFKLSERYPTYRVLGSDGHVDVTSVRGGSILADLAERDFTINAMAVPLAASSVRDGSEGLPAPESFDEGLLLDPFDGATHLKAGRLVAVSDHIFADDPLRLMRAARFCHTLGLAPDPALADMIESQAAAVSTVAMERVVNEMSITLAGGRTADVIRLWEGLGLFAAMLPEVSGPDSGGGETGAFEMPDPTVLRTLDDMLEGPDKWFSAEAADLLRDRLQDPVDGVIARPVALRLAGLVQGIGAERAYAVGGRLKLSGAMVSLLAAAARCSARARGYALANQTLMLDDMLPGGTIVSRAAVLYLWDAAPWEPEVVLLAAAGVRAQRAGAQEAVGRMMTLALQRARGIAPPPVDGEDLMRELGLKSGPLLGRVLREARLAWEAGEAATRSEVLEVARRAAREDL